MLRARGFTLIELLVVLAVVAMLLGLVAPRYMHQVDKAKEAALKENLSSLRTALDQFYSDKGHYPEQLDQLVDSHYLRSLPLDPVTNRRNTWKALTVDEEGHQGIYDVQSGAPGNGMDGSPFRSW